MRFFRNLVVSPLALLRENDGLGLRVPNINCVTFKYLLEAAVHSSGRLGVNYQSPFMLCQTGPSGLLSCVCHTGPRPIHPRCRSLTPNPFLHISWTLPCKLLPNAVLPQPRARILNFAPNSSLKSDNRQTPGQPKNPIGRESGQLEEAPSARKIVFAIRRHFANNFTT